MRYLRQRGTEPIHLLVTSSTALPNLLSSGVKHPFCDILIKWKTIPFNYVLNSYTFNQTGRIKKNICTYIHTYIVIFTFSYKLEKLLGPETAVVHCSPGL